MTRKINFADDINDGLRSIVARRRELLEERWPDIVSKGKQEMMANLEELL